MRATLSPRLTSTSGLSAPRPSTARGPGARGTKGSNGNERASARHLHAVARGPRRSPLDEIRALDARHFVELPRETLLELTVPAIEGSVWVTGRASVAETVRHTGQVHLDPSEWLALVVGVESERLRAEDFVALCRRKLEDPERVITLEDTLDGAQPDAPRALLVADVLSAIGAALWSYRFLPEAPQRELPLMPLATTRAVPVHSSVGTIEAPDDERWAWASGDDR